MQTTDSAAHDAEFVAPNAVRRLDIQGLRAIAVIAVVLFHSRVSVPGGFVGVDVFFVISGFVITSMLQRQWLTFGRLRMGQFYWRRFTRLTPALATLLTVVVGISIALLSPLGPQQIAAETSIGGVFFVANFVIQRTTGGYFDPAAELNPLLNIWSLSVEEQFYFVFPFVMALAWQFGYRRRGRRAAGLGAVVTVGISSFILMMIGYMGLHFKGSDLIFGFYSPATRAWEFSAGAVVCFAGSRIERPSRTVRLVLAWAGAGLLLLSFVVLKDQVAWPGPLTILPVAATCALIIAGSVPNPVSSILSCRPLVAVGNCSYSIYLWHWPLIVFADLLWPDQPLVGFGAAVVALGPALVSFRWIEQPMRQLRIVRFRRRFGLAAAVLAVPLATSIMLLFLSSNGFFSNAVRMFQDAAITMHLNDANCLNATDGLYPDLHPCRYGMDGNRTPIYLVGDSNAHQYGEGVVAAGANLGRPVEVLIKGGCPAIDLHFSRLATPQPAATTCHDQYKRVLEYLCRGKPGTVFLSNSDRYWVEKGVEFSRSLGGEPDTLTNKWATVQSSLESTIRDFEKCGHAVVVAQAIPMWTGPAHWDPTRCNLALITSGGCVGSMRKSEGIMLQGQARSVVSRAAQNTGVRVWDPWAYLCSVELCETSSPRFVRYRDEEHISVAQSTDLEVAFLELFRQK